MYDNFNNYIDCFIRLYENVFKNIDELIVRNVFINKIKTNLQLRIIEQMQQNQLMFLQTIIFNVFQFENVIVRIYVVRDRNNHQNNNRNFYKNDIQHDVYIEYIVIVV